MYLPFIGILAIAITVRGARKIQVSPCRNITSNSKASLSNYPYFAIIDILNEEFSESSHKTPGVIVAAYWVLSTSPCYRINSTSDCDTSWYKFVVRIPNITGDSSNRYRAELIKHESYSWIDLNETFLPSGDIVLYKLKRRIRFNLRVQPLNILRKEEKLDPGSTVRVIGLLSVQNRNLWKVYPTTRQFNVILIRKSDCEREARLALSNRNSVKKTKTNSTSATLDASQAEIPLIDVPIQKFDGHLCAADPDAQYRRFCRSYEGSVLLQQNKLAGLLTFPRDLIQEDGSPVYTYIDVTHYKDWITSHIGF